MKPALYWLPACMLLAISAAHAMAESTGVAEPASRPHIVWIVLDALRAENLSSYGYERATSPNIDALAADGVLFEQAYAQAHATRLSVPSYMTGRYFPAQVMSFGSWKELWHTPPPGERYFPQIAQANGYRGLLLSATPWIYEGSRLWNMFDQQVYLTHPGSAEAANAHLFQLLSSAPRQPHFIYMHLMETHCPHNTGELAPGHLQWVDQDHPRLEAMAQLTDTASANLSAEEQALLQGLYDGSIHYEDEHIGLLIAHLKKIGIYDSTLFIVTADHGEALAEDGQSVGHLHGWMYEQTLRVPLIMAGPGLPKGLRFKQPVQLADIVPTLIEIADLDTAAKPHGKSLVPAFDDPAFTPHEYVFSRYARPGQDDKMTFVLISQEHQYHWNPAAGTEHLWSMPYRLGREVSVLEAQQGVARTMRGVLASRYVPKWEAARNAPRTTPTIFVEELRPEVCITPDAHVWGSPGNADWTDNKWTLKHDYLAACSWRELPPPITFRFDVPNGAYRVELYAAHSARMEPDGHRASSFRFAAQGSNPQTFTMMSDPPRNTNWHTYVTLGEFAVTSRTFELTLAPGETDYWAIARRLKFVPLQTPEASTANQEGMDEALRALGYLE